MLKKEFLKADIEDLKKRRERLLTRQKEIELTLKGIELKIRNKERLLE